MSRKNRNADIDVSAYEDVEVDVEVEVEPAPEEVSEVAPIESPKVKPARRGVGGEYITRDGKLTRS